MSFLDKNKSNLNSECLLKRNRMKSVLGLGIRLENPIEALVQKTGFKVCGFGFQVCIVFEKDDQGRGFEHFKGGARNARLATLATETGFGICYEPDFIYYYYLLVNCVAGPYMHEKS